jgi:hypothetical protein
VSEVFDRVLTISQAMSADHLSAKEIARALTVPVHRVRAWERGALVDRDRVRGLGRLLPSAYTVLLLQHGVLDLLQLTIQSDPLKVQSELSRPGETEQFSAIRDRDRRHWREVSALITLYRRVSSRQALSRSAFPDSMEHLDSLNRDGLVERPPTPDGESRSLSYKSTRAGRLRLDLEYCFHFVELRD